MSSPRKPAMRRRGSSIKQALQDIETNPSHHLAGPFAHPNTPIDEAPTKAVQSNSMKTTPPKGAVDLKPGATLATKGLWGDITSLNWTKTPSSALFLMSIPVVLYLNWRWLSPDVPNPFAYLIMIQYRIDGDYNDRGQPMYRKGYGDLAFLAYYVIVFSFIRQSLTIHVFRPMAQFFGIRSQGKMDRYAEQGYALVYFSTSGALGLWAMYSMDTWYFDGPHFFQDYPYWRMTPFMKSYYLLQLSYWLQQFLILILGLEKPRKDYNELVTHHIVTLWLIGWSYLVNLTPIGNAVFITMDISDVFLALSKGLNYMGLEKTSAVSFAWFVGVWSYCRHYLNLYILWAVYKYFDLIPETAKRWAPSEGVWMAWWIRWQILFPLVLLQGVNLFWYFLIWRILIRAVLGPELKDERSDDEDEGQDGAETYVVEKEE